jgi:hypothetical protein
MWPIVPDSSNKVIIKLSRKTFVDGNISAPVWWIMSQPNLVFSQGSSASSMYFVGKQHNWYLQASTPKLLFFNK